MVRAVLAYDGTDFAGFQPQRTQTTVGGALETALSAVAKRRVTVTAAGRTDAGVHATAQVVGFRLPCAIPLSRLIVALRSFLPQSLSLHEPVAVTDEWSARFDARERRYVYLLLNAPERCALRSRYTGFEPRSLDIAAMRLATAALIGRHDFRSFCGVAPERGGTEREIFTITIERVGAEMLRFEVRGDGFLHRMVRIIVGTLIEVGFGRRSIESVAVALAAADRRLAGRTAAASGLYLAGVRYDDWSIFREPPLTVAMTP